MNGWIIESMKKYHNKNKVIFTEETRSSFKTFLQITWYPLILRWSQCSSSPQIWTLTDGPTEYIKSNAVLASTPKFVKKKKLAAFTVWLLGHYLLELNPHSVMNLKYPVERPTWRESRCLVLGPS